jgi:hypothetical protein
MATQLQKDFCGLVVADTATLWQALFVFDNVYLSAFAECSQKVGLLLDYLFISDDIGYWPNLRG